MGLGDYGTTATEGAGSTLFDFGKLSSRLEEYPNVSERLKVLPQCATHQVAFLR